jgi:hypothetical protein
MLTITPDVVAMETIFNQYKGLLLLTKISMVPLVIFVGICKAWKKDVFSGPSVVAWAGTLTSNGATAPALAGALTYNYTNNSENLKLKVFHTVISAFTMFLMVCI